MTRYKLTRRGAVSASLGLLLAGCQVIPGGSRPAPTPTPADAPQSQLPRDEGRHSIALLVPLTGRNAQVGKSIENATAMALKDTNSTNLRITSYDTNRGPEDAARQAMRDGNKLILGPLLGGNIQSVLAAARPAGVPVISFSNDVSVAQDGVYLMGHVPAQSITRSVRYARGAGKNRFAALVPTGDYGSQALAAYRRAVEASGGTFVTAENYDRRNTSIISAAERLKSTGGYDTVLLADSVPLTARAAGTLNNGRTQYIGTELWSGESGLANSAALRGSWFSTVSDNRYRQFRDSYASRYGAPPYRIATIGYDAVLLTLNVARDWKVGSNFPTRRLRDRQGFIGLDGTFRFMDDGVAERAMEVRAVRNGTISVVSPAPATLD
ncbi:penicillin-binding protein activator [Altererythrobacter sp. CAU 1778]